MAKATFYDIKDAEGNVIDTITAVSGGQKEKEVSELLGTDENNRTNSSAYIYKPGGSDDYAPVSSAQADIKIDPSSGKIVVSGPKWLTSEIVNSESFKKNYSENKTLLNLVNQVRKNPLASFVDPTSGETVTASSMIKQFQESATNFSKSYGSVVAFKEDTSYKFGVNFTDDNVFVASNSLDKENYSGTSVVYVPKWAMDKADWKSSESWNEKDRTVSADDFFKNIYSEGFTNKVGSQLQDGSIDEVEKFLKNNTDILSEGEDADDLRDEMSKSSYSDELARTMQLANIVNGNRPNTSAAYNAAMFGASVVSNFAKGAGEAGYNISSFALEIAELPGKIAGNDNEALGALSKFILSPISFPAIILGEAISFVQDGMNPSEWCEEFKNDMLAYFDNTAGEAFRIKRDELVAYFDAQNERMSKITGAWAAGEVVGDIAWFAVENALILNPIGKAITATVEGSLLASSGIMKFATKFMSVSKATKLMHELALVPNVIAQGMLDTLLNDKNLIEKVIDGEEMSDVLWSKLNENILWNGIGEYTPEVIEAFVKHTTAGKAISQIVEKKIVGKAASTYYGIRGRLFTFLNGGDWKSVVAASEEATVKGGIEAVKGIEKYNTALDAIRSRAWKTLSEMPIFKEASEADKEAIEKAYKVIFGERYNPESIEKSVLEEAADASKPAEEISEKAKKLRDVIDENYKAQQKMMAVMVNMENQIDALSKGNSIAKTNIETYAEKELGEYNTAQKKVAQLEHSQRSSLTFRDSAGLHSKEVSEYLSYRSQQEAYRNRLARFDSATGEEKSRLLNSWYGGKNANVDAARKYLEEMNSKLGQLSGVLGDELAKSSEELLERMSAFTRRIDDYMISKGYYSQEQVDLLMGLRKSGIWGEDGKYFIHTGRLFADKGMEESINILKAELKNPTAFSVKMMADDPKLLKPGNIEDSFVDPNTVLTSYLYGAARVAQGQEWGRAVHAMSIATQGISEITDTLDAKTAQNALGRSFGQVKKAFYDMFDTKDSKAFTDAIEEGLANNSPIETAIRQDRAVKKANEVTKAAQGDVKKNTKAVNAILDRYKNVKDNLTKELTRDEMSAMIASLPDTVTMPSFNFLNMSAKDFEKFKGSVNKRLLNKLQQFVGDNQSLTITNLKRAVRSNPNIPLLAQKSYILDKNLGSQIRNTDAFKSALRSKFEDELVRGENIVFKKEIDYLRKDLLKGRENIAKANEKIAANKDLVDAGIPTVDNLDSFGEDFTLMVHSTTDTVLDNFASNLMKTNADFKNLAEEVVEKSGGALTSEEAAEYLILDQFKNIKAKNILSSINKSNGTKKSLVDSIAGKVGGFNGTSPKLKDKIYNAMSNAMKNDFEDKLSFYQRKLATELNASEYVDMDNYWGKISQEMDRVQSFGLTKNENTGKIELDKAARTKVIQMVDNDGSVKYYKIDPLFASVANAKPNFSPDNITGLKKIVYDINSVTGTLFRWGTTGIDNASYVNQWFRDPQNAFLNGFAVPFTDLGVGGIGGGLKAVVQDAVPFGTRIFGEKVTTSLTKQFIESTFDASEKGLVAEFGEEFLENIREVATKGLAGEAAEKAYRRAVVEYAAGKSGLEALPGLGAMTEAEFYRSTERGLESEVKMSELRRKSIEEAYGKADEKAFGGAMSKMREKFDNFVQDTSRGGWREGYLRKAVYAKNYKTAIQSGMTMQEAKVWATRYALDATTDFNRTFSYANQFIKSVPYLGAAINGQKSFWRLLALDPIGVSARITYGLTIPYMALLSESLSDPENLKAYKNIEEWEKEDSLIFVNRGAIIKIPMPQELSGFVAPFRQMIEKSADANDISWLKLITSDVLGAMPVDLSGFIELEPNDLLSEDKETGIWATAEKGLMKAASSLMPPLVRSAYMFKSGKDPYTGNSIDSSYTTIDEDGNEVIMDKTQTTIANKIHEAFPELSASAAQKILQTLLGRSTMSVLDTVVDTASGNGTLLDAVDKTVGEYEKPFTTSTKKNAAARDWQEAINIAYQRKEELANDEGLKKALSVMRNEANSEEKRQGARATYEQKMDEYAKFVLGIAKGMKEKYPEAYTTTRLAQIVSLLTMDTGVTANDTPYYEQLQTDMYYQARDAAIDTLLRMGYPTDTANNSVLGTAYYNSAGEYQFKVFTPYEIQQMQNVAYGAGDQFQAMIEKSLKSLDINTHDMWDGYRKVEGSGKAAVKKYKQEWNTKVVTALYPIFSRYGTHTILNNSSTRDMLDNYLFIDNPFKTKEYLYKIFGGEQ